MPKFSLNCEVTVSAYTVVEAATLEEAIELSRERDVRLDFNGAGTDENSEWLIEEADGCPKNIEGL